MTENKLKPCPFCGNTHLVVALTNYSDERDGYNFEAYIECDCGARLAKQSKRDGAGWCCDKGEAAKEVRGLWNNPKLEAENAELLATLKELCYKCCVTIDNQHCEKCRTGLLIKKVEKGAIP